MTRAIELCLLSAQFREVEAIFGRRDNDIVRHLSTDGQSQSRVLAAIGHKMGTGGSSGVGYLISTLFHPVFGDLWEIRSRFSATAVAR